MKTKIFICLKIENISTSEYIFSSYTVLKTELKRINREKIVVVC